MWYFIVLSTKCQNFEKTTMKKKILMKQNIQMASKIRKIILWAGLRPTFIGWMSLIPPFYENPKLVAPLRHLYKSLKHIPKGIKIRKGITNRWDILMTGGVKKSHLRKAHPVWLLERSRRYSLAHPFWHKFLYIFTEFAVFKVLTGAC